MAVPFHLLQNFPLDNVLTKQRVVFDALVDSNFDRVFDDNDKKPRHPELNVAIMTSQIIDGGIEPHIALEVKQATGKDDDGDEVKYSDFSAFYAPSVGDQIVNWYANK